MKALVLTFVSATGMPTPASSRSPSPRYSSIIYPFFRFPVSNSAKLHAALALSILFVLFISPPFSEFLFSFRFLLFVRSACSDSVALLLSVFLLRELLRTSGPSWKTTNFPPYSTRGWTSREVNLSKNNFGHCNVTRIAWLRYCIILETAGICESCFSRKHREAYLSV